MESPALIHILYIDDEIHNLNAFKASFRRLYNVYTANSAAEGLEILKNNEINIIITDQRMPVITGIEFLRSVMADFPDPVRMLLTGYTDVNLIMDALNTGCVYKCIQKPWVQNALQQDIEEAFDAYLNSTFGNKA
jgi:response regulator RpfG family c-di-GMP phosphodiesterase